MKGGEIPYVNRLDCECNKNDTRLNKLNTCVPFYNMITAKTNIFLKDEDIYYPIYYEDENQTSVAVDSIDQYVTSKDDMGKDLITYKSNINVLSIKPKVDKNYLTFNYDRKVEMINRDIEIKVVNPDTKALLSVKIPAVLLFANHEDVFNMSLTTIKTKDKIEFEKVFRIMKLENGTLKFIGMSMIFNIFNLFLFTHNYLDLMKMFVLCFNNISNLETVLKTKVGELFDNKKNFLIGIYDLAELRKMILVKLNITKPYGEGSKDIYLNTTTTECFPSTSTTNVDINNVNIKYNEIINIIVKQIIHFALFLENFSKVVNIEDFKYLFLMAILSYRLINNTVTGGWGFSIEKTLKNILDISDVYSETKIKFFQLRQLFIDESAFPTIYESKMTKYKNRIYGNCMENVILQFWKLIFWNIDTKKYDLSRIDRLIKDDIRYEYRNKMRTFFNDIDGERESQFIDKWTEFITELSPNYILRDYVELNPMLKNLYIMCSVLLIGDHIDFNTIKSTLQTVLNDFNIDITSLEGHDTIVLTFGEKTFTIELYHSAHALFKEATTSKSIKYSIFSRISNWTMNDLNNLKFTDISRVICCKDIIQTMVIKIFSNENINEQQKILDYIMSNYRYENIFKTIIENVMSDNMINIRETFMNILVQKDYIITKFSSEIWMRVLIIESSKFWNNVLRNKNIDDILQTWDTEIWRSALFNIEFLNEFLIKKNIDDILQTWNTEIWGITSYSFIPIEFWHKLLKINNIYDILNKWDKNTWLSALHNIGSTDSIGSTKFWDELLKINNIDDILNKWDSETWENALLIYENSSTGIISRRSIQFWNELLKINNIDDILNKWDGGTWETAFIYIESIQFWNELLKINNIDDILNKWDGVTWQHARADINSPEFWTIIKENPKYAHHAPLSGGIYDYKIAKYNKKIKKLLKNNNITDLS
jgi:hypothetical protein